MKTLKIVVVSNHRNLYVYISIIKCFEEWHMTVKVSLFPEDIKSKLEINFSFKKKMLAIEEKHISNVRRYKLVQAFYVSIKISVR